MQLRAVFYKNHPGHGDQGWTNLSKLGPYTSIDEPLFMAMKIPASVAPVFLDKICLISPTPLFLKHCGIGHLKN